MRPASKQSLLHNAQTDKRQKKDNSHGFVILDAISKNHKNKRAIKKPAIDE
jgi:hypothetical protein